VPPFRTSRCVRGKRQYRIGGRRLLFASPVRVRSKKNKQHPGLPSEGEFPLSRPMRAHPDRDPLFEDALARIGEIPPNEGLDILLHYFLGVLNGMDLSSARQMRDELVNRFGGRYCSSELCKVMAELVNGHLALRQPSPGN
jgi:hypothetical protein